MATHRLREPQDLPEGRGHGRSVAPDRGQDPAEHPGRRDGPLVPAIQQHEQPADGLRPRLRRAVRAADRAPRARGARLLRDRPVRHHRRGGRAPRAGRAHPLGRSGERLRRGRAAHGPARSSTSASRSWASATASRRWRCSWAARSPRPTSASTASPSSTVTDAGVPAARRRCRETSQVWMSHRDSVGTAPEGFTVTARTGTTAVAAMEDPERKLYATQFHPEVAHTEYGQQIIRTLPARHRGHPAAVDDGQHHRRRGRARSARRSATPASSAACPAAWTPASSRRCCTARSATSSPASSSTTACCASTRPSRSCARLPRPVPRRPRARRGRGALPGAAGGRDRSRSASATSSARSSGRSSSRRRPSSRA